YSCTNGDLSGATYAGSGSNDSTTCSFADNGTFPVKARIIDKDGGFSEYTTNVIVNNVAPSVTAAASQSSDEGAAHSFELGSFSATASATCSTTDNGVRSVKGKIEDKDGGVTEYTASVTVNNVNPVVQAAADQSSDEGASHSFALGSFNDPGTGDSPWHVVVDWGDGHSDNFDASSQGSL